MLSAGGGELTRKGLSVAFCRFRFVHQLYASVAKYTNINYAKSRRVVHHWIKINRKAFPKALTANRLRQVGPRKQRTREEVAITEVNRDRIAAYLRQIVARVRAVSSAVTTDSEVVK